MNWRTMRFGVGMLAAAAGLWAGPVAGVAQGGTPGTGGDQANTSLPVTTLTLQTKLVSLDVVVVDAEGKPVGGLKRGDFTIYGDNKPFPIKNFDSWEARPEAPVTPTVDKYGRLSWGQSPGI